jgi:carbon-monoxide dehydrogenase medium subunit
MYPAPFNYYRPSSLQDAIALLSELGDDVKIMSGGQTLIPMLKLRVGEPSPVVDIARLPDLSYIKQQGDTVYIGALTTHQTIANSELGRTIPIIKDCAGGIADCQVRARGTIGGSLSAADPNCDWPTLMRALNADIVCLGPDGERVVNINDFIVDAYTTTLQAAELVTEIRFSVAKIAAGSYVTFKKAAPAYPSASAAVILELDRNDICTHAQFTLGCCGPIAKRLPEAEQYLIGQNVNQAHLERTAELLVNSCQLVKSNTKGSEHYQERLLKAVFIEAANRAVCRSHGTPAKQGHLYA